MWLHSSRSAADFYLFFTTDFYPFWTEGAAKACLRQIRMLVPLDRWPVVSWHVGEPHHTLGQRSPLRRVPRASSPRQAKPKIRSIRLPRHHTTLSRRLRCSPTSRDHERQRHSRDSREPRDLRGCATQPHCAHHLSLLRSAHAAEVESAGRRGKVRPTPAVATASLLGRRDEAAEVRLRPGQARGGAAPAAALPLPQQHVPPASA
jgi:hypothetical protein